MSTPKTMPIRTSWETPWPIDEDFEGEVGENAVGDVQLAPTRQSAM